MNKDQLLAWAVKNVTAWPSSHREVRLAPYPAAGASWSWTGHTAVLLNAVAAVTRGDWEVARLACGIPAKEFVSVEDAQPVGAARILQQGVDALSNRAAERDQADGERSMARCVEAFNVMFGHQITEEQGWQFMELLKMSRAAGGAYREDDYVDGAAYAALAGEAAARERGGAK